MNYKKMKKNQGFTLIEILVVIGIIAILAAIVIIAINPARQFAQARNTQRNANVNSILNAIGQRTADNKGVFEGVVTTSGGDTLNCGPLLTTKGAINDTEASDITTKTGDLGCLVPTYIPALPKDPTWSSGSDTLYDLQYSDGRVTVCAPKSVETDILNVPEICVTR